MKKKLKSELTWSFSRDRLFKECQRAYYYHYYASWGGWESNADEFSKKAYILKNIRGIDAWVGDIAHQMIKWLIDNKLGGKTIAHEEAIKRAKEVLMRTWEQSRSKMWRGNVKYNLNLFEHYYNADPTREELSFKLAKVTKAIKTIYACGLLDYIGQTSNDNVLRVDELDSFLFEGTKVFAIPDFALKNNKYILYDWKTGNTNEKDRLQLSFYLLYAMKKWKLKEEDVQIVPVYLSQELVSFTPIEPYPVSETKDYIRNSLKAMKKVLTDPKENKADAALCQKTQEQWRCKRCKFKEICK